MLKAEKIIELMRQADEGRPGISIIPRPADDDLRRGVTSIDLRLGRWFMTLRQARTKHVDLSGAAPLAAPTLAKYHFVPFGEEFILHRGRFVLGISLEWITLPPNVGAYVTGKSSLGRHGLIIETASGIHPGFSGCLALELANVGEVPLSVTPGMRIAQIFLHAAEGGPETTHSEFAGRRRPILGKVKLDGALEKLRAWSAKG